MMALSQEKIFFCSLYNSSIIEHISLYIIFKNEAIHISIFIISRLCLSLGNDLYQQFRNFFIALAKTWKMLDFSSS